MATTASDKLLNANRASSYEVYLFCIVSADSGTHIATPAYKMRILHLLPLPPWAMECYQLPKTVPA